MSGNDGRVIGAIKVVDNGPDDDRWNLVIMGDGYREEELPAFHGHAQRFIDELKATPPFDELFAGINVFRIDVVSNESGADDPGCGGGPVVRARTFFDARFCTPFHGGPLERLLTVDNGRVLSVANQHVRDKHQVVCIVNAQKYGGSGGSVATCSANVQSAQIAIHELGHSAFGLADEYGGDGTGTPGGEPDKPNVTRNTNRASIKWGRLIAVSTALPTQCHPGCVGSGCIAPGIPPAPGVVGAFEGGIYSDCGTYRPTASCYMRDYQAFCPVCSDVIRQTLLPFLPE